MSDDARKKAHKRDLAPGIREKIEAVAATATETDHALFKKINDLASTGKQSCGVYKLNPAVCALIFIQCNGRNRNWRATGPKSTTEYARRMQAGDWAWNGQGIGFYTDGKISDGQHRLSGAALAGYTWATTITFGVDPVDAAKQDDGQNRHPYHHFEMNGGEIGTGVRKQNIITTAGAYFKRVFTHVKFDELRTTDEIERAMHKHDKMLTRSLQLADTARSSFANPLLAETEAARVAFVMLYGQWPEEMILHTLTRVQVGQVIKEEGGDKSPLYVCTEIISDRVKGKNIGSVELVSLVMNAAQKYRRQQRVSKRVLKTEMMGNDVPDPNFELPPAAEAA